ncbi:hypothetical protein [Streptomyces sp. A244]|uniref:hypothetical protein n=1 Tax=Streptomyces sp. A244 TaxID=2137016 RepID=UPI0026895A79|nr:hypothetical protein [Streptomyces sp. A244]
MLAVGPEQIADWLRALPVDALPGIGPRQAQLLRDYGIHCVGLLAALPPATMQRLLGGRAGRLAADRARGIDPRPVAGVLRELEWLANGEVKLCRRAASRFVIS